MSDEQDQPENEGLELVVPFTVCQSAGGPYDDTSFVAGFQAGTIDQALKTGAATSAESVKFPMVYVDLLKQLDLIGMNRGYPLMRFTSTDEYPDWAEVTFYASANDLPEA